MGKYFGTDGVRGIAGADLTCELAMKLGRGVAACPDRQHRPQAPHPDRQGTPASRGICWKPP